MTTDYQPGDYERVELFPSGAAVCSGIPPAAGTRYVEPTAAGVALYRRLADECPGVWSRLGTAALVTVRHGYPPTASIRADLPPGHDLPDDTLDAFMRWYVAALSESKRRRG